MNAISWSKSSWGLAVPYALILVVCLAHAAGFRINPTPSLPKGLYRLAEESPAKGDLVTFAYKASLQNWLCSVVICKPVPVLPAFAHC